MSGKCGQMNRSLYPAIEQFCERKCSPRKSSSRELHSQDGQWPTQNNASAQSRPQTRSERFRKVRKARKNLTLMSSLAHLTSVMRGMACSTAIRRVLYPWVMNEEDLSRGKHRQKNTYLTHVLRSHAL